jgi:ABC-type uncharacterized transport system permease subunit
MHPKHHIHLLKKMRDKGWSDEELARAHAVFTKSESTKSSRHKVLDACVLWGVFGVMVIGNFFALFALMPFFVIFPNGMLYSLAAVLGLCFGLLYDVLLRDIQHTFNGHHHALAFILVPYLAIVGAIFILGFATNHMPNLFHYTRHPLLIGFCYVIGFLIPYVIMLYNHKLRD